MTACDSRLRTVFFFLNIFFGLTGLTLIIVGSYFTSESTSFSELVPAVAQNIRTPLVLLIVLGIIIIMTSGFGWNGVVRESKSFLIMYAAIVLGTLIGEIGTGAYALAYKDTFTENAEKDLNEIFIDFRTNPLGKQLFQKMEREMECCGINFPKDYIVNLIPIPKSCCKDESDCTVQVQTFFEKGCKNALIEFSEISCTVSGSTAIAASAVGFLSALIAIKILYKYLDMPHEIASIRS